MNSIRSPYHRWFWAVVLALLVAGTGRPLHAQGANDSSPRERAPVAPALARQLARSRAPVSFLIILTEQPDPSAFLRARQIQAASREERGLALYRYLTDFARRSQAPLWAWLDARGISYRPFYIVNMIEVSGDAALVEELRRRTDVARLAANPTVRLSLPEPEMAARGVWPRSPYAPDTAVLPETPYGIRYANAPAVWDQGYRGQGIVVASQDTGVFWEHPALKDKYRGWNAESGTASHPYNWFDAWGTAGRDHCDPDPQTPCDDNGHGTHTVGTLVGSGMGPNDQFLRIGMAPEARWIGCRNMNRGAGTPASYTACFEFFLAPYPQNGDKFSDGDPSKAPHIINNSWYCPPDEGCDLDSLRQVVQTVRAAGEMIVASAGNSGPECSTIKYPISAYPEVFSVGAHNGSGTIAGFSSRGPVTADGSGRRAPHIAAAGVDVLSSYFDGSYTYLSGTSMASPHVAGAVALLWSAVPHLIGQIDETEQILMKSAHPVPRNDCGEGPDPVSPNNTYGHGRLDVAAALQMARQPGSLTVTLANRAILEGASVVVTDTQTGYRYTGNMDNTGQLRFARLYAGNYTVALSFAGHTVQGTATLGPGEDQEVILRYDFILYMPVVFDQREGARTR